MLLLGGNHNVQTQPSRNGVSSGKALDWHAFGRRANLVDFFLCLPVLLCLNPPRIRAGSVFFTKLLCGHCPM
jgi:hypothetical protein